MSVHCQASPTALSVESYLIDDRNDRVEVGVLEGSDVSAVQEDSPHSRSVEVLNEVDDGGLATPASADDREGFPSLSLEGHPLEDGVLWPRWIREVHVLKENVPPLLWWFVIISAEISTVFILTQSRQIRVPRHRPVEQIEDFFARATRLDKVRKRIKKLQ